MISLNVGGFCHQTWGLDHGVDTWKMVVSLNKLGKGWEHWERNGSWNEFWVPWGTVYSHNFPYIYTTFLPMKGWRIWKFDAEMRIIFWNDPMNWIVENWYQEKLKDENYRNSWWRQCRKKDSWTAWAWALSAEFPLPFEFPARIRNYHQVSWKLDTSLQDWPFWQILTNQLRCNVLICLRFYSSTT